MPAATLSKEDQVRESVLLAAQQRHCRQRESDLLKQIFVLGSTAAGKPSLSPADLDAVVFVLLSVLHGLVQEMLLNGDSALLEPAVRILSRTLINGLTS